MSLYELDLQDQINHLIAQRTEDQKRITSALARANDFRDRAQKAEAEIARLCDAAQAIIDYDGDDAKPPYTDLLLTLEAEVSRSRGADAPALVGGER